MSRRPHVLCCRRLRHWMSLSVSAGSAASSAKISWARSITGANDGGQQSTRPSVYATASSSESDGCGGSTFVCDGRVRSSSIVVPAAWAIASFTAAAKSTPSSSADGRPSSCSMRARIHHSSARSPTGATTASEYCAVGTIATPPLR